MFIVTQRHPEHQVNITITTIIIIITLISNHLNQRETPLVTSPGNDDRDGDQLAAAEDVLHLGCQLDRPGHEEHDADDCDDHHAFGIGRRYTFSLNERCMQGDLRYVLIVNRPTM